MTTMRDAAMSSKAWPFEEARRLLKRYEKAPPEKGFVLFETGYGPSGLPHIGTFGEVLRTTMIRRAFDRLGIPFSGAGAELAGGEGWRRAHQLSRLLRSGADLPTELWVESLAGQGAIGDLATPLGLPLFDRVVIEKFWHEVGGLKVLLRMRVAQVVTAGAHLFDDVHGQSLGRDGDAGRGAAGAGRGRPRRAHPARRPDAARGVRRRLYLGFHSAQVLIRNMTMTSASQCANLAMVFPGQGSQSVGMLAELAAAFPAVEETFAEASAVLGYDLWKRVRQGPAELLNHTACTQPAMLTAGVATWRVWIARLAGARTRRQDRA